MLVTFYQKVRTVFSQKNALAYCGKISYNNNHPLPIFISTGWAYPSGAHPSNIVHQGQNTLAYFAGVSKTRIVINWADFIGLWIGESSCRFVRLFFKKARAVSDLDRSMNRSLWV